MANFLRRGGPLARMAGRSAWRALASFYRSDNLTYAASIAYYSLVSLFPLLLLAFALLGQAASDPEDRNAVLQFVLRYFPANFEFITAQLDAFRGSTLTFGVAGTIALVWGALGVFGDQVENAGQAGVIVGMQVNVEDAGEEDAVSHLKAPDLHVADQLLDYGLAAEPAIAKILAGTALRHLHPSNTLTYVGITGFLVASKIDEI